jgi:bacteriorhodopsin
MLDMYTYTGKSSMNLQTTLHWLYVAGMTIGALRFWSLSRDPKGVPQSEYLVAIFIPIWSGLAYMAMALDQGKVEVAGRIVHYARYVDWMVTTPLLLMTLSWTAMQFVKKDWTLIGFLMSTQIVVITTGLIADLSAQTWVRYLWYICGTVAFLIVLWGIWVPLQAKARGQGSELARLYKKLIIYFAVLWIGYPVVWIIGPSGFGFINRDMDTLLFCILPFFSKVGFSFLDLHGLRGLQNRQSETGLDRATVGVASPLENRVLQFLGTGNVLGIFATRSNGKIPVTNRKNFF